MKDNYFLDTNILVYAHSADNPEKQETCRQLIFQGIKDENAVISAQVLGEFIVTMTRKIKEPLPLEVVTKEIQLLHTMKIQEIDFDLVLIALKIQKQALISYWDSLIVAAAKRSRCNILYSEDLNDGQVIFEVQIINPFH